MRPETNVGVKVKTAMPNRENFYSSETQDILGKMPHWIIRWGITLLFVIFGGIILGCWFIKYPQTVIAPVVITTLHPPADLVARYEGKIDSIYVEDGATVVPGAVVAVLYNPADYRAVQAVERKLNESYREADFKGIVGQAWLEQEHVLGGRLQKQKSKVGFDASITTTELGIMQTQQQLIELSIQHENELAQYERNMSPYGRCLGSRDYNEVRNINHGKSW
ncbi:MAG: hypothetical protein RR555_10000 [Bacteroidales bacterium]